MPASISPHMWCISRAAVACHHHDVHAQNHAKGSSLESLYACAKGRGCVVVLACDR